MKSMNNPVSSPTVQLLRMQKPIPAPLLGYKLPHAVLPPQMESKLPENVLDNIYSFLRRRQTPAYVKQQRLMLSINLKVQRANELRREMIRRRIARLSKEQKRRALIQTLDNMVTILEKSMAPAKN